MKSLGLLALAATLLSSPAGAATTASELPLPQVADVALVRYSTQEAGSGAP